MEPAFFVFGSQACRWCLNSAQQHDQQNDHKQKAAAGEIAPARAVGPGGESANEEQNEQNKKDRIHDKGLVRLKFDQQGIGV